jgi:omega-6 fatty acid desaturase (delta-12 desaturase)
MPDNRVSRELNRVVVAATRAHEGPVLRRSLAELAVTVAALAGSWCLTYLSLDYGYALTLLLALPTGLLVLRLFAIQHDCGHHSFFASRRANIAVGLFCSLVTLIPHYYWWPLHARHHRTANNLEHQTQPIAPFITLAAYGRMPPWRRVAFRLAHSAPFLLLIVFPLGYMLIYRAPFERPRAPARELGNLILSNVASFGLACGLGAIVGFGELALVHLPVMYVTGTVGVWLCLVQHQFEGTLWYRTGDWNRVAAALYGTSFVDLPQPLHWLLGNIGYHHIHHLNPRVPCYRLAECHAAVAAIHPVCRLDPAACLRSLRLILWDEGQQAMIAPPRQLPANEVFA